MILINNQNVEIKTQAVYKNMCLYFRSY